MPLALTPPVPEIDGVSRRDFLRFGGLGVLGLSAAEQRARAEAAGQGRRACILLLLNGGASPLETFDPKPQARGDVRGPARAISTATPGLFLSENLPRLAQRTGTFALLRSLATEAAPIHESGLQLLQTGRLVQRGIVPPAVGSVVARLLGARGHWPANVVLPRPLGEPGALWRGEGAGSLGNSFDPWQAELDPADAASTVEPPPDSTEVGDDSLPQTCVRQWLRDSEAERRGYGSGELARSCLAARKLIERGTRFVTINMFDTLAERITWDCHANGAYAPADLSDYRNSLCPELDEALSALLDDLGQSGLLAETLVVVSGEFGRTPRVNRAGGRDHWTGVWSALVAGCGIVGGRAVGSSDAQGAAPADRPIAPAELAATMLHCAGVDLSTRLTLPDGSELSLADAGPLAELWS